MRDQKGGYRIPMLFRNGPFRARGVVLGQLGDGIEQVAAERVVQVAGRDAGLRLQQVRGNAGALIPGRIGRWRGVCCGGQGKVVGGGHQADLQLGVHATC